jgi:hypothetical protein
LGFHGRRLRARNRHSLAYFKDALGSIVDDAEAAVVETKHLSKATTRMLCEVYSADYSCLSGLEHPPACKIA